MVVVLLAEPPEGGGTTNKKRAAGGSCGAGNTNGVTFWSGFPGYRRDSRRLGESKAAKRGCEHGLGKPESVHHSGEIIS
jgi:hypothetical protein